MTGIPCHTIMYQTVLESTITLTSSYAIHIRNMIQSVWVGLSFDTSISTRPCFYWGLIESYQQAFL